MKSIHVEPKALHCHYDGQSQTQSVYVEIDWTRQTVTADYDSEIGNAVPFDVWHGLIQRYTTQGIPVALNNLLDAIAQDPRIRELADTFTTVWDGNNYVANFGVNENDSDEIVNGYLDDVGIDEFYQIYSVDEYWQDSTRYDRDTDRYLIRLYDHPALAISADTPEATLEQYAIVLQRESDSFCDGNIVISGDCLSYLTELKSCL